MSSKKKTIFPKVKKKLKWFLTDESGKITKKHSLGLSVAGVWLAIGEDVMASHTNSLGHANQVAVNASSGTTRLNSTIAAHSSWIVNGHYNRASNVPWHINSQVVGSGHANQVAVNEITHSNHGSHSSCGRGCW